MPGRNAAAATASTADRELVFERVFDAPRDLVFEAWTDPHHLAHWWGPTGFSLTVHEYDLRPQGVWRFIMHGPDGTNYNNRVVFVEVVPPERLVYRHVPEKDTEPVSFEVTVTFAEEGKRTRINMQMLFPSATAREVVVKTYGADEGARQTLARLEAYVTGLARARGGR